MWDQSAAENGGMPTVGNGFMSPRAKHLQQKKRGNNTLRLLLAAIAALLFALVLLYAVLARNKPGLDPVHGLHMGDHQGKLKGFPKIKRIVQRRGLTSQHEDYHGDLGPDHHHGDHHEEHGEHHGEHHDEWEDEVQTITKEMDMEHLEHAGFDPEAAAYEDGNDVEDLGYDEEIESDFDEIDEHGVRHAHQPRDEWHVDHHGFDPDNHHDEHDPHHDGHHGDHHGDHGLHHDEHHEDHHGDHHEDHGLHHDEHHGEHEAHHEVHAEHGGEVHDGRHIGAHGAHARNLHNVHSGHHVGDDSSLHMGEDHFKPHHGHPHHEHGHDAHGSHGRDAHAHDAHWHGHEHGHEAPEHGRHAGVPANQQHHGGWKSHEGHEEDPHDKEHKIKVRARLAEIFPKIDTNHDMHIDQAEMLAWHDANGRNTSARRAKREFTWADTNQDGQVTLAEYLADLMPADFKGNETLAEIEASPVWKDPAHEWVLHNKATFLLADEDKSGGLNEREHFAFSHPEDSANVALHAHLRRQDIIDRDRNHDNKLDYDEFHDQLWYTLHEWEHPNAEPQSDDHVVSQARFHELDVNKDNHLDADELAPVFHLLHPGEHEYARMQALHQMTAADNSGDGKLTLSEMVSNPYVFYGSSVVDEEGEEAPVHDEF